MQRIRFAALPLLAFSAVALVACGGGGSGGGGSVATASVAGRLVTRDGSTADLGGVAFTLVNTGGTATTSPNGSFSFPAAPAGTIVLRVIDPSSPAARVAAAEAESGDDRGIDDDDAAGDGSGAGGADDGDAHDVGDDDFDVGGVEDGEHVEVEVSIRDGKIESLHVARSADDRREAEARLVVAAGSDDPDAAGEVKVESRPGDERLAVEAEHLTAGRLVEAFVTLGGVEATLGTKTVTADGHAEWRRSTLAGDALPAGAATARDLAGAEVVVRDASTQAALVHGTVPELPDSATAPAEPRSEGEARLLPPAAGPGEGSVEARRRVDSGVVRQRVRVEVEHLAVAAYEVWLENPAKPGTLAAIGTVSVGELGEAELELDTHDGDSLPFGVTDVSSLVGMRVEVRRASDGVVVLAGAVPALVSE